jgi:deoxyribose-phosphate aldolase
MDRIELARRIDHTCLRPDATARDVERACEEALAYGFHAVCVAPTRVAHVTGVLAGTRVRVCTVVGFPHGNTLGAVKLAEADAVLRAGAHEVDMVAHIGALKDGDDAAFALDVERVADTVHETEAAILKVILETALLTDDEIVRACGLAESAGADFVKTSTGFAAGGATLEAVRLMRRAVGERLGVKAAGGIRDRATALAMLEAGATRLGTSASVAIIA